MLDEQVAVPDIAGWRRERMPMSPQGHKVTVIPDWVCEILSPSTESKDRRIKMPLYARYGVPFAWLVDPIARTLEAYELPAGGWQEIGYFSETDQVAVAPFEAVTLDLSGLWLPTGHGPTPSPLISVSATRQEWWPTPRTLGRGAWQTSPTRPDSQSRAMATWPSFAGL